MLNYILVLTLGLLLGGSLSFAMLPAVWVRAKRLILRELEAGIPISMAEVRAGQDHLRAQAAIQFRKLEREAQAEHDKRQEAWAQIGRQIEMIRQLTEQNALLRDHSGQEEVAKMRTHLQHLEQELLQARHHAMKTQEEAGRIEAQAAARADAAQALVVLLEEEKIKAALELDQAQDQLQTATLRADAAEVMVVSLESDKGRLLRELKDSHQKLEAATHQSEAAQRQATALERDKEKLQSQVELAQSQRETETATLHALLENAKSLIADLQREVAALKMTDSGLYPSLPVPRDGAKLEEAADFGQLKSEISRLAELLAEASGSNGHLPLIESLSASSADSPLSIAHHGGKKPEARV